MRSGDVQKASKRAMTLVAAVIAGSTLWAGGAIAQAAPACETLRERTISADRIGLPTHGAVITRARRITPPTGDQPYCLVSGEIAPIDPTAPDIKFQVALPTTWNGKALMIGGGGFDGSIRPVSASYALSPANTPTPLAQGYVVFAGDGGHQSETPAAAASVFDSAFFENDEAYRNYIGEALKKTHDAAIAVIEAAYGRAPSRSYFQGGSKGGGEAITAAARWPEDWDGVVAWCPAKDYVLDMLGFLRKAQAMAAPGAYLDLPKRAILYQAALAACDALDGVRDGIISDEKGCNERFDPATATLNGAPLRCPGGRDTGGACLSDPQIAALKTIETPMILGFMPGGSVTFPGFNVLTADLGASETSPLSPSVAFLTIGTTPPSSPNAEGNSIDANFVDRFFRVAVTKDTAFNDLAVNLADPGPLVPRLRELARLDQLDADLSGFAKRGGKLIVLQGTADMLISPRVMEQYDADLRARMGDAAVDRFLRFYEIPGFGHGPTTVFAARFDDLAALDAWVERDDDPAEKAVVADAGHGGRTRPLCLFPNWPKYKGSGDPNAASSFVCAQR